MGSSLSDHQAAPLPGGGVACLEHESQGQLDISMAEPVGLNTGSTFDFVDVGNHCRSCVVKCVIHLRSELESIPLCYLKFL